MDEVLRRLGDAEGNRERAEQLLRLSDKVLLEHAAAIVSLCTHVGFEAGSMFAQQRVACLLAVRSPEGALPGRLAEETEAMRAALARFAFH